MGEFSPAQVSLVKLVQTKAQGAITGFHHITQHHRSAVNARM